MLAGRFIPGIATLATDHCHARIGAGLVMESQQVYWNLPDASIVAEWLGPAAFSWDLC